MIFENKSSCIYTDKKYISIMIIFIKSFDFDI